MKGRSPFIDYRTKDTFSLDGQMSSFAYKICRQSKNLSTHIKQLDYVKMKISETVIGICRACTVSKLESLKMEFENICEFSKQ